MFQFKVGARASGLKGLKKMPIDMRVARAILQIMVMDSPHITLFLKITNHQFWGCDITDGALRKIAGQQVWLSVGEPTA